MDSKSKGSSMEYLGGFVKHIKKHWKMALCVAIILVLVYGAKVFLFYKVITSSTEESNIKQIKSVNKTFIRQGKEMMEHLKQQNADQNREMKQKMEQRLNKMFKNQTKQVEKVKQQNNDQNTEMMQKMEESEQRLNKLFQNQSKEMEELKQQNTIQNREMNQNMEESEQRWNQMFKNHSKEIWDLKRHNADQNREVKQQMAESEQRLKDAQDRQSKRIDHMDKKMTSQFSQMENKIDKNVNKQEVKNLIEQSAGRLEDKINENKLEIDTKLSSLSDKGAVTNGAQSLHMRSSSFFMAIFFFICLGYCLN